jgi:hypothetical protein
MTLEGLVYWPEFLAAEAEQELLAIFAGLEFDEIRMRGQVARRTALHYGVDYDYDQPGRVTEGEPIPEWLASLRDRCADLAEKEPEELVEALCSATHPAPR